MSTKRRCRSGVAFIVAGILLLACALRYRSAMNQLKAGDFKPSGPDLVLGNM